MLGHIAMLLREWKYWHISRKTQKFIPWVARKLPKRVKYFVVIDGMAAVTVRLKPDIHPEEVTGMDLLKAFEANKNERT